MKNQSIGNSININSKEEITMNNTVKEITTFGKAKSISREELKKALNHPAFVTTKNDNPGTEWIATVIRKVSCIGHFSVERETKKDRIYVLYNGKTLFKARFNKSDIVLCIPGMEALADKTHGAFGTYAERMDFVTAEKLINEKLADVAL